MLLAAGADFLRRPQGGTHIASAVHHCGRSIMPKRRRASALASIPFFAVTLCVLASPARAQDKAGDVASLTVELGDVSLTKLPFIMAADYGIYENNRLKVRQYITP